MQITVMPLETLRAAPYNPRVDLQPGDARYRKLRRSIKEFGLVEPLIWNRQTGQVVGGHQRLKILRELGVAEAAVSVVDLSPERERALNVVLNNRAAQSDWDLLRLTQVLEELASGPTPLLPASGFEEESLRLLRSRLTPADPVPPPTQEPHCVEVVLTVPMERFAALRPDLDVLLQRHQLESHVRCR